VSKTPRTDAVEDATGYGIAENVAFLKRGELSRQLERELAAAIAERDALIKRCESCASLIDAAQKLDAVTAERDTLKAKVDELCGSDNYLLATEVDRLKAAVAKRDEVIARLLSFQAGMVSCQTRKLSLKCGSENDCHECWNKWIKAKLA